MLYVSPEFYTIHSPYALEFMRGFYSVSTKRSPECDNAWKSRAARNHPWMGDPFMGECSTCQGLPLQEQKL
ncbi:MAG TPA: hypothetical protein DCR17_06555 [Verrucomicrobiales bacterium]|nr:hypothetical protein [Pedosphaera sp.]MBL6843012.1 hypothetical protein [Verrucomicrobiae bacterium]HAO66329.1 hypothetical protein [Verrucomicrobiales bacterium]HAQ97804.1 hypothetical protein [Verrucomicrobiales bacterium]HAW00427.1 hypothetical protein [Verrucomicrobiales bacterium]